MGHVKGRQPRPPLDGKALEELALRYVGRFATTRAKLKSYLNRKLRERGWSCAQPPALDAIAEQFAQAGYVDDAAYALAKARALTGRGFGKARVVQSLRVAGVDDDDGAAARDHADAERVTAALRFAERRRIGPFAKVFADPKTRERALGAMIRAGHDFGLARAILKLRHGCAFDPDELRSASGANSD